MEAMTVGYPPEQRGRISVTATKEEWHAIACHMWADLTGLTEDSVGWKLLHMLGDLGVE